MPADPTDAPLDVDAESAIVARLLDPPDACTITELQTTITDVSDERVDAAITSLAVAGVIRATYGGGVHPTPALARLDRLGLIAL
jgi:hypothetical protein